MESSHRCTDEVFLRLVYVDQAIVEKGWDQAACLQASEARPESDHQVRAVERDLIGAGVAAESEDPSVGVVKGLMSPWRRGRDEQMRR